MMVASFAIKLNQRSKKMFLPLLLLHLSIPRVLPYHRTLSILEGRVEQQILILPERMENPLMGINRKRRHWILVASRYSANLFTKPAPRTASWHKNNGAHIFCKAAGSLIRRGHKGGWNDNDTESNYPPMWKWWRRRTGRSIQYSLSICSCCSLNSS